ncbi:MAG: c-type cytochrome biogenesis protein CcmI [Devosia sp.]|jgi:cytochrome c-type biogenesis protein CcmH|uniref:c-type cytochrome biogenesis protein CcmI n=1 Tax=unclassified Devosia TaxID=196773 RepID=UPI0019DE51E7|nr:MULTISPECIES: c-type cytochrome biogenesis protein CcmI [unclassified Devosia]MBF0680859.1 c-type cytochrome biogenesis protein CcmI [Devosia sp.]WEJ32348.1 c-type cytochrome biogenesis protein CcmI [Devosia sp. SD17-2]
MIFWSIVIAITALTCAALFYAAAGRAVNATEPQSADHNSHFRLLLAGIEADRVSGKIGDAEAEAARAELAREVIRVNKDKGVQTRSDLGRMPLIAGLGAVAAISLGLYAVLGSPELPGRPLADRPELAAQSIDIADAINRIEAQLAATPDDVRGWTVIAPAYAEMGRFADAANAYRRIIALNGPTPELQTRLAEALLLEAGGAGSDEAIELLRAAIVSDPQNARAHLYLASELMRTGDYEDAARIWQAAIDMAQGDEPWLNAARQGLAVAQNDGIDNTAAEQTEMIEAMVTGLSARLETSGGTVEEWMRLVQSYIVLGDLEKAQSAYDASVAAYPAAFDRGELDTIALRAGLKLNGDTP